MRHTVDWTWAAGASTNTFCSPGIGVGLIVVTHSLEFAERHADLIIIIDEVRSQMGSKEILRSPKSRFLQSIAIALD